MATIFMATADLQDLNQFGTISNATISSDYARTGSRSFKMGGTGNYGDANFDFEDSTYYVRTAILINKPGYSGAIVCMGGGVAQATVNLTQGLGVTVY